MKERIRLFYDKVFYTPKPFPPGNYQIVSQTDDGAPLRMHLRIEKKGEGIFILNASTILHLNPTATEIAYHIIQQTPENQIVAEFVKRYKVDAETAIADVQDFKDRLHSLIHTPDLDPEMFLDVDRVDLHSTDLSAPLRLDCALTYQMSDGSTSQYAPTDRVTRNLDTEEWKSIINKAWQAGIPHVVFTGGEPTIRPDLPELVRATEDNGQVAGLITDGMRFTEKDYLHQLLQAGLDHVLFILDPGEDQSWEALRDVMGEDIFVTVHLTINSKSLGFISTYFDRLKRIRVKSLSLSGDSESSKEVLKSAQQKASEYGFSLVWDLPVPYSANNPINLELETANLKSNGRGKTWLYVEPDGDVLPAQGVNKVLGNFLSDKWESIWLNASRA
jgi:organic radical activating enzyme